MSMLWVGAPRRGIIYPNQAAEFNGASRLYVATNSAHTTGDIDFTVGAWVYLNTISGFSQAIVSKYKGADTTNREWDLWYLDPEQKFGFTVRGVSTGIQTVTATVPNPAVINHWYFVVGWHDSANDQIGIYVGNSSGTRNSYTAAWANGVRDTTNDLSIGARPDTTPTNYIRSGGRIDEPFFYKNRVLSVTELDALYKSGTGSAYADLSAGQKTNLTLWFGLNDDGTWADQHTSGLSLTEDGTVINAAGKR